jgi:hypothetical protein
MLAKSKKIKYNKNAKITIRIILKFHQSLRIFQNVKLLKSEILNSKSETNHKFKAQNFKRFEFMSFEF